MHVCKCLVTFDVDPPGISTNVQVIPLSLTSMNLTWDPPLNFTRCVQSYVAQFINGTDSTSFSSTNNVTMFTVNGLTQGVHYAITVAASDGQGRTGEESEQVFYALDGKQIQIVNQSVKSSYGSVLPAVKNITINSLHSNETHLIVHIHWIAV